ncbi:hypothetical protein HA050_08575 [Iodobacter sp. HSC-16F04]|uniref:Uncharacterized protein n=1 Tax=Iodobacter violaceini TaxID=3044271 RepID=A0ABX0KP76_9NEIS|nr:Imm26 family immunity protein [Iodobacter violacea]NHQ86170.1 hypothetical protein [Iodobacter violacea]
MIPLEDGTTVHAIALPEADFAFFDTRAEQLENIKKIFECPILFRVAVHKSAWSQGRWLKVGKVEVPAQLMEPVATFIQDPIKPENFQIYLSGNFRPATKTECVGLSRCAVWEPSHVEDRLRDHYQGRPNIWIEQMRLK